MDPLPFIDELSEPVPAPADVTWAALVNVLRRRLAGATRFARLLRCDPVAGTAEFAGRAGEAIPGFRVAESEAGRRLVLRGRHRFADYSLTFVLDGEVVRAHPRRVPGLAGRIYRTAVIGSGGHRRITRSLLRRIAREAGPLPEGAPTIATEKREGDAG
ncbi:MAG: hypothetical protein R2862_07315 [Thermoanaerobaculia bacterium]